MLDHKAFGTIKFFLQNFVKENVTLGDKRQRCDSRN